MAPGKRMARYQKAMPSPSPPRPQYKVPGRKPKQHKSCWEPTDLQMGSIPENSSNFGQRGSTEKEAVALLYQPRMGNSSTGSVTTKKELSIKVTDFFDYTVYDSVAGAIPQDVTHYSWNCNQNLFNNAPTVPGDLTTTFCRVRDVCVWVLPAKGFSTEAAATNGNNAEGMFTVNVQAPGAALGFGRTTLGASEPALATDTQVTNVTPQFDTKWKKVFHCNLQKTFQSGVIRPYFRSGGGAGTAATQCLFSMSITDSTTGKSYLQATDTEELKIRVKVQLTIDQPISTFQQADLSVYKNEDFTLPFFSQNGADYDGTVASYVQMDLKGARDNMR